MASDKSPPKAVKSTTGDVVENDNADQNTPTRSQSATATVTVTPPPPPPASSTPPTSTQVVAPTPSPSKNSGVGGSSTPKRAVFSSGGSSSGDSKSAQKKKRSSTFKTRLIEAGNDVDKPAPCWVCRKQFDSWKALFGHMRCHPDRQWRGVFPPPSFNPVAVSSPDQTDNPNQHRQKHQIVLEMNNTANTIIDANRSGNTVADLPSTLLKLAKGCLEKIDEAGPSTVPQRVVFDFDLNVSWEPLESPTASENSPPPPPPPPRSPTPPPPPPPGHGLDLDLNKPPPQEE